MRVLARQVMARLELRRQQHRLQMVTKQCAGGSRDPYHRDRRYVFANPAYAELIDKQLPDIIGHRMTVCLGRDLSGKW